MVLSPPVEHRPAAYRAGEPNGAEPTDLDRPAQPPAPSSLARWAWVAAGLLLTGFFMAALLVGGGAPAPPLAGLPDAGAVTGWGSPLVDLAVRVLAVLTVGQLTYAALLAPTGPAAGWTRALRGTTWSATGWLVAEVVALVLTASSVYGVPVTQLSLQAVLALVTELPAGRAAVWVAVLLGVLIVGSASLVSATVRESRGHTRLGAMVLLLVALSAVVVPGVLAGHSAAADNHVPAVLALSVHVVTASLWVGGLAGLLLHGRGRPQAAQAVRRFSALALVCVALLLASGVAAALLVAGPPTLSWIGEGWVWLLSLKTALLGLLAAIGWWHRRRTVPALVTGRPGAFVRLGVVEVALMTLTLAVSVALTASPAPAQRPEAAGTTSDAEDSRVVDDAAPQEAGPGGTATEVNPAPPVRADESEPTPQGSPEDMSGHDHGDLSVSILVDEERFHVAGTVRPGQSVTVYNSSRSAATISALDGSFDADVGPRTFITFTAPAEAGDYDFASRAQGIPAGSFTGTLLVRADP
ncbi:copper resistance D family protein [Ornithinimicrobium pratense]|uniref:Copper resistance protein D domain-containing protein n=1 Tax=Ornithinimicrobium pratense TaxID=2593973 RepID=A0A5J6V5F3_9MICO|nr:CopD family protein [Ornithinimicrobium pratense]QFG68544.1 hypothetical protein FY030_07280 [Ornithinimicrobium pratense]